MKKEQISIGCPERALSKQALLGFLQENDSSHFVKLSDLVNLDEYAEKLILGAKHFCLFDGDRLIGFSGCYFNDPELKTGYISGISVLEGYRGVGLGSRLLQRVIAYGRERAFHEIRITPDRENRFLINFLCANGFVEAEEIGNRILLRHLLA